MKMDKKFKISDQPKRVKIIYASVIGVLCVTALVIGIITSAPKTDVTPDDSPVINIPSENQGDSDNGNENQPPADENNGESENKKPEKLSFVSPLVGRVTKYHSLDTPVFSNTLNEWRVHTGIDISAEEGSQVYASAEGTVTRVYTDPFLGKTIEISHTDNLVSIYSNLDPSSVAVKEGDIIQSGAIIGCVGDSSLSELADEGHLHFGMKLNGVSVNPLDYISEASKQASLGITDV